MNGMKSSGQAVPMTDRLPEHCAHVGPLAGAPRCCGQSRAAHFWVRREQRPPWRGHGAYGRMLHRAPAAWPGALRQASLRLPQAQGGVKAVDSQSVVSAPAVAPGNLSQVSSQTPVAEILGWGPALWVLTSSLGCSNAPSRLKTLPSMVPGEEAAASCLGARSCSSGTPAPLLRSILLVRKSSWIRTRVFDS